MAERILIAMTVLTAVAALTGGGVWLQKRRATTQIGASGLLRGVRPGTPVIVYFWTEACAPCQFVQSPALDQLEAELGEGVQVIRVNAMEHADQADAWGVLTVPTTIVIGPDGETTRVNNRPVALPELRQQIAGLG